MTIYLKKLSDKDSRSVLCVLDDVFKLVYCDSFNAVHGLSISARRKFVSESFYDVEIYSSYFTEDSIKSILNSRLNLNL